MSRMGKVDFSQLQDFVNKLEEQLAEDQIQAFIEACAKKLAGQLLRMVIEKTPVGDYSGEQYTCKTDGRQHKGHKEKGMVGGTLRRGWTAEKEQSVDAYVNSLNVVCTGDTYTIEIVNPVEYAPYVEFGHRKRNGGWVEGHFMLTISSQELQAIAPKVLEKKLQRKLGEAFK